MLGLNGMIGGSSIVFGPVLGGVLVDAAVWRTIFLINLPIGASAVWLVARTMPESSDREHAAFDPAGQLLGLLGLLALGTSSGVIALTGFGIVLGADMARRSPRPSWPTCSPCPGSDPAWPRPASPPPARAAPSSASPSSA